MQALPAELLARRSQWAVDVVRGGARAVSPVRAARALRRTLGERSRGMRPDGERSEWIEQRLVCDPGVAAAARQVVGEVLGGRVATSVVKRAELVISELVADALRRTAGSGGELVVRLARRRDGCRLEVRSGGRLPVRVAPGSKPDRREALGAAFVEALSERWGFEQTAEGDTRVWAELSYAPRSAGAHAGGEQTLARRAGVTFAAGQPTSDRAEVHVVPDERAATWHVYDAGMAVRLSEHATETEAEAVAGVCAHIRGAPRVVIHDRYHRTREATIAGGGGGSMPVRRPRGGRFARATMTSRRR